MVLTHIMGGLGNQMFQYAFGRALALSNNVENKLDLSSFEADPLRELQLECFNIKSAIASRDEIALLSKKPSTLKRFGQKLKLCAPSRVSQKDFEWFQFDPKYTQIRSEKLFLKGYWQTYSYMEFARSVIEQDFTFKILPSPGYQDYIKQAEETLSVSLHIRRGDYVNHSLFNTLDGEQGQNYYKKATQFIREQVENPTFFVFSDDPEWAKDNLKIDAAVQFIENLDPKQAYEDLRLMSHCKHNIIANSSFSWWGAYLNKKEGKLVTAPKAWLNAPVSTDGLIPPTWQRL